MRRKKDDSNPNVQAAVSRAVNYEISIVDLAKKSERRAWIVAACSLVMSIILAGGYFYVLPLKEKVPFLVMADPFSGTATVARLQGDSLNNSITSSEALNRSNVSHFITARESYDVALMQLDYWKTVYTMATPEVASGYTLLHSRNNPSSPYATFGSTKAIRVRILSIVFEGGDKGRPPRGATVRFQRNLYDKTNGSSRFIDNKIATLTFKYDPNLKMSESDRVANPLGFRVTGYRVDSDFAETPSLTSDDGFSRVTQPAAGPAAAAAPATQDAANPSIMAPTPELPDEMQVPGAAVPQAGPVPTAAPAPGVQPGAPASGQATPSAQVGPSTNAPRR
jgi:type IV secretion system protein VirB8